MPNRVRVLMVPDADRAELERRARSKAAPARDRGLSVSHDSITILWRKCCLAPHRTEGFKFSTDPQLHAKIRDFAGLYLAPPQNAVVICVDDKPQIQALDRTRPRTPDEILASIQRAKTETNSFTHH